MLEDQVTYPLVSALTAAPNVKSVRGISIMGASFIYVIFEDGTDIYWARSRVLEYIQGLGSQLPPDAEVSIGPDATAVGWVFQYALQDKTGKHDLQELRTLQDWYIRYILQAVPGVAEVAVVGGFEKQYVVEIDPNRLSAYGIPLKKVIASVKNSNKDVGGRTLEFSGREYLVWGQGYIEKVSDLENVSLGATTSGVPIRLGDVANIVIAPNMRRGVAELNGEGEVVGAVVSMRYGENALNLINRIKKTIEEEVKPMLPEGVELVVTYDRSELIERSIETLKHTLTEEIIIVSIIIFIFLMHLRSAMVPAIALPIAVAAAFIPMLLMKTTANIMSLGGIAISIGVIVDASVVMVDNSYRALLEAGEEGKKNPVPIITKACRQVGRPIFFSLVIIVLSFLPVFLLEAQEGRLFKPLAWTKTLTLTASSILAITLIPALLPFFLKGRLRHDHEIPVARWANAIYNPIVQFALKWRKTTVATALVIMASAIPMAQSLGSEFMPPLQEGSLLYMPVTFPGVSITEATRILQMQDRLIKTIPEVKSVYGKAGRHESSLDPAPLAMIESVILLKPEDEWRTVDRWYSDWAPEWLKNVLLRGIWRDRITTDDIIAELDKKVRFAGWQNAWTQPIKTRIDMLTTGIRTPVGVKVLGGDLKVIERISQEIEKVSQTVQGTRSAFAERVLGGTFFKIRPKREVITRYGLNVGDVLQYVSMAMGGMPIDRTVEGRERYTITTRFARGLRTDLSEISRIPIPLPMRKPSGGLAPDLSSTRNMRKRSSSHSGISSMGAVSDPNSLSFHPQLLGPEQAQVPLGELADIELISGPQGIRDENGLLAAYVFLDVADRDIGSYVTELKEVLNSQVRPNMPPGYTLKYSGQYEFQERAQKKLSWLIPAVIVCIFVLLVITFGSVPEALLVMMAVPFALCGGVFLQFALGWNWSVAVWIGYIALFGVAVETGVVMVIYLDEALDKRLRAGDFSIDAIREAAFEGAALRLRPKLMTVGTTLIGITPVMWSSGTGSDVMKPIATPLIGGVLSSTIAVLIVIPVLFYWLKCWQLKRGTLKKSSAHH